MTIYCIGRNYAAHAKELGNEVQGEPVVFLKAENTKRGLESSPLAFATETFHHEVELVLRIGRQVSLGQKASWNDVDSMTLGLDLTRRGAQDELKKKGLPWTLAKSFKGSAIVGPWVERKKFPDLNHIQFSLSVNGVVRQKGDTSLMLFPVPHLLTFLASFNELQIGDLVFTGTPEGVGPIKVGDAFDLTFENLGVAFSGIL